MRKNLLLVVAVLVITSLACGGGVTVSMPSSDPPSEYMRIIYAYGPAKSGTESAVVAIFAEKTGPDATISFDGDEILGPEYVEGLTSASPIAGLQILIESLSGDVTVEGYTSEDGHLFLYVPFTEGILSLVDESSWQCSRITSWSTNSSYAGEAYHCSR